MPDNETTSVFAGSRHLVASRAKRLKSAAEQLASAIRDFPALAAARLHAERGQPDAAIERLGKAVVRRPQSQALTRAFTDASLLFSDTGEAIERCERRLAARPSASWTWHSYVFLLHVRGRHGEIERLLDRCLESASTTTDNALLAVTLAAKFSPLAFDRIADKAAERIGSDREARRLLAMLQGRAGNLGLAFDGLDGIEGPVRWTRKEEKLRKRARRVWNKVEDEGGAGPSASMRELRVPETPLELLVRRSSTAPVAGRHLLSMAVTTLGPGGAERQLANTVNGLRRHGLFEAIKIVRTRSRDDDVDGFYQGQFEGDPLPMTTVNQEPTALDLVARRLGRHVPALLSVMPRRQQRYLARYLTEFVRTEPRIVHCWSDQRNMTAGAAAVIVGVPRVILGTRSIAPPGNRPAPRYAPAIYRALLTCPSVRMINNSRAGATGYEAWLGLASGSVGVVYNGIDVDHLLTCRNPSKTRANREKLGLPEKAKVVGSIIRFSSEKRPRLWLDAAASILRREPDAYFVLIGDGEERAAAMSHAQRLGLGERIRFLGLVADVVPWYDLMDVVLMTSSREGTSNTALEAQALGKPLITTDAGGMGEALAVGESGHLVSVDASPEELANQVCLCLGDRAWRQSAAVAGERFIRQRFSIERMAKDTADLYDVEDALQRSA